MGSTTSIRCMSPFAALETWTLGGKEYLELMILHAECDFMAKQVWTYQALTNDSTQKQSPSICMAVVRALAPKGGLHKKGTMAGKTLILASCSRQLVLQPEAGHLMFRKCTLARRWMSKRWYID